MSKYNFRFGTADCHNNFFIQCFEEMGFKGNTKEEAQRFIEENDIKVTFDLRKDTGEEIVKIYSKKINYFKTEIFRWRC